MKIEPQTEITPSKGLGISSLKAKINLKSITGLFSGQSLTKKASLNALSSGLDYVARLVVGFLVNPILLTGLGDFYYGVWQFLGRLIGYISPATGRPSQALKWTIAKEQASVDYDQKRLEVGKALSVWVLFLPIISILGGLLAWFAPVLLKTSAAISPSVRLAAAILVANVIMVSLAGIPRSVLEGENLGYKRMGLSALLVFLGGGLMVLAVYLNMGIGGVAASKLVITILTGLLFYQVVRSYVPWFGFAKPTFASVRKFMGLSGWFIGWNLVMKLMIASDVLVLGVFASAEMVTNYTLNKYVPETIVNIIAIIVQGIIPGLGGVLGSGDVEKTVRIRSEVMTLTWLVVTVLGATVLMWNQSFLRLWVGPEYYSGTLPMLLIMLMIIQFILIRNDAFIIDLTLDLRSKVFIGLGSAIVSLVIASILVNFFDLGIVGLCLGFIVGRSIMSVIYPRLVGKLLNVKFSSQLGSMLRPFFVTLLLFSAMLGLEQYWSAGSWLSLIFYASLTFIFVLVLAFYAGLVPAQRAQLWKRTQYIIKRGKQ